MKIFKEEQRFTQTWLIILLASSVLIPIGIIVSEYYQQDNTKSVTELITIIGFMILCVTPIFFFKLKTRIDEIGIHYQFLPFHFSFKTLKWSEIISADVRNYDAISEFGGWGLKGGALWNKANGKAINVSGDIGIQLELKNGKKLLIGTQKEEAAKQVLATFKTKLKKL